MIEEAREEKQEDRLYCARKNVWQVTTLGTKIVAAPLLLAVQQQQQRARLLHEVKQEPPSPLDQADKGEAPSALRIV